MKDVFDYSFDESRVLYRNDFETGLNGWEARGPTEEHFDYSKYKVCVELTDEESFEGKKCMKISGRTENWNGAMLNITEYLSEGIKDYEAMVRVKLRSGAEPSRVHLSVETNVLIAGAEFPECRWWDDVNPIRNILSKYKLPVSDEVPGPEDWDITYPPGYTNDDGWVLLRGTINITKSDHDSVYAYIETSGSKENSDHDRNTNDIYVDDFILLKGK